MEHLLPDEIIREILCKLPTKSLIRFTLVCKSWSSMIRDQSFIAAQLRCGIDANHQSDSQLLLLQSVSCTGYSTILHKAEFQDPIHELYSLHYDNHAFDEYCKIELPNACKDILHNPCFRVVGTCNGLVCLADDISYYCYNLVIWNPSLRKLVTLPRPGITINRNGLYDTCVGFANDAMNNDYKVVRVVHLLDKLWPNVAEVYSLATGLWRSLGCVTPAFLLFGREPQAFVKGALHWAVYRRMTNGAFHYLILAFDVGSEQFREVLMPKSLKWNQQDGLLALRLSVSGDGKSITLFTRGHGNLNNNLDIWEMKEYCLQESWTKLVTLAAQGPERPVPPDALCFRKSSEVMVVLINSGRHELVSLDPESKECKDLGIRESQHYFVGSYVESLVLLDNTNAVSY